MALKFSNTKGKAASKKHASYDYKDNENVVRMVGGVLARYVYWVKGTNNKDIPIECLSFDRELEKFTNVEKDLVPTYWPGQKCSWAYTINCIDVKGDGEVKVLNLKKKLFEQIIDAAESLGDPTDPDTGWDIVFKRTKTGPLPFNVEYNLLVLKCKPRALTPEERQKVDEAMSIDEKFPRPTVSEIQSLIDRVQSGATEEEENKQTSTDKEAIKELG